MVFQIVGSFAQATVTANNANVTVVIPAGYAITGVTMVESNTHAVTGGVKVGKTSGATDVIAAQAVGSNAAVAVADAAILIKMFSGTADQTLFIQPVTSWNAAIVLFKFYLVKAI